MDHEEKLALIVRKLDGYAEGFLWWGFSAAGDEEKEGGS
jgi:hypothetical protein